MIMSPVDSVDVFFNSAEIVAQVGTDNSCKI